VAAALSPIPLMEVKKLLYLLPFENDYSYQ